MYAVALLILLGAANPDGWQLIFEKDGFKAFERAGTPPSYRAEATVKMDLAELAAVFTDIPRQKEWVSHLAESWIVAGDPLDTHVVYSRFTLPWPMKDRDTVVQRVVTRLPQEGKVVIRFHQTYHPTIPARSDCIRVPLTEGEFSMAEVSRGSVHLTYTVRLDPGGRLPSWLVRTFVRDAPYQTLRAFQFQVERTRGQYDTFVARERAKWEREKASTH